MRTHHRNRQWIAWALCLVLTVLGAGVAAAQQDSTETWRDRVDENDIRYLGTVTRVGDGEFDLRTHSDGVMTFTIPTDADYGSAVFTGNEVQVWVDGGTVTFAESYGEPVDGERTADAGNADTDVDVDVEGDVEETDERTTARAELSADVDSDERADVSASASATVATDEDEAATESWSDDDWDEDELPQTGTALPALAGIGGLLMLLGLALRFRA